MMAAVSSVLPSTVVKKQEGWPVWQAGPVWSTLTSRVSASQSASIDFILCTWPDSSPFFHIFCLLRLQKWV